MPTLNVFFGSQGNANSQGAVQASGGNRYLTLDDFRGRLNNGQLSLVSDLQTVLESSPLAQFKHLPDIRALASVTFGGGGGGGHTRSNKLIKKRRPSLKKKN